MCYWDQYERIYNFTHPNNGKTDSECSAAEIREINDGLRKCKELARCVKSQQVDHQSLSDDSLIASLPSREICDSLVRLYMKGFEPVCR